LREVWECRADLTRAQWSPRVMTRLVQRNVREKAQVCCKILVRATQYLGENDIKPALFVDEIVTWLFHSALARQMKRML
jgi:hypothetical protein